MTPATAAATAGAPPQPDLTAMNLPAVPPTFDREQLMQVIQNLPPGIFKSLAEGKEQDPTALASLAHAAFSQGGVPGHALPPGTIPAYPGINDPGPSSHPRGPPNLGQLGQMAVATQPAPQPPQLSDDEEGEKKDKPASSGGRRGGRGGAAMGSDEWARQRKDNHKEVERRRRGNINEGINELGRIVPSGSGEKAKGAILSRAVQYIHHLKENEARNIEKWTLEKLLMDQAMGDLQAQLEEVRRMWEEERLARQRAEAELEVLRGNNGLKANGATKRPNDDGNDSEEIKRQRTD